jgi:uncharacterized protein (TIGR03435 family)
MKSTRLLVLVAFVAAAAVNTMAAGQFEVHRKVTTGKSEYWKARAPVVGDPAPPLVFDEVVWPKAGGPDLRSFDRSRLAGRVVVLEFFGTWCGPCLAFVPHMNDVIEQTADLPVTILTIGNEGRDELQATAAKYAMKGTIVRDANGSTFEDYWVGGLPAVVLIDAKGQVLAYTHPSQITRRALEDALAGRSVKFEGEPPTTTLRNWDFRSPAERGGEQSQSSTPLTKASLERTDRLGGRTEQNLKTGEINAPGMPATALLAIAWGATPNEFEMKTKLPQGQFYNAHVVPPDGSLETARGILRGLVEQTFKIKVTRQVSPMEAYVLKRRADAPALPTPASDEKRVFRGPGLFQMRDATMDDFAREIGRLAARPVVNETGLEGRHNFDLKWDIKGGQEALLSALSALGFTLERGKANVNRLVVEAAENR